METKIINFQWLISSSTSILKESLYTLYTDKIQLLRVVNFNYIWPCLGRLYCEEEHLKPVNMLSTAGFLARFV